MYYDPDFNDEPIKTREQIKAESLAYANEQAKLVPDQKRFDEDFAAIFGGAQCQQ